MLNSKFGRILGQTEEQGLEQPFKYFGQYGVQHESEVTYYMRARYYDAELGRFLKEDPIGFEGGLNVSLYVGGNPVVGIDPSGLQFATPIYDSSRRTDRHVQSQNDGTACVTADCAAGLNNSHHTSVSVNASMLGVNINIGVKDTLALIIYQADD